MRAYLKSLALLVVASCASTQPSAPPPSLDNVEAVAQDYWEILLVESPMMATQLGDRRFDAMLPNISHRTLRETHHKKEDLQHRLSQLNVGFMQGEQLLTARVMAVLLRDDLGRAACNFHLWSIDQIGGLHLALADLATYQTVDSASAAAAYVARLGGAGQMFDQHLDNLRLGLAKNLTAPHVIVQRVLDQVNELLTQKAADAPYLAVLERATALSQTERTQLRQDIIAATETSIQPALKRYQKFLQQELLPRTRTMEGLSALTDGDVCYQSLSQEHGGRSIKASEWHNMGLAELDRLRQEMAFVAEKEGFGSADDYAQALATKPSQHTNDRKAIVQLAESLVKRAEAALPKAFVSRVNTPLTVRAVEAFHEKAAPSGYYEPAAMDGAHAAVFYINTYKPATRHLYNMEALTFHEGVPGHHLQISEAQTLKALPLVRRHMGPDAFIEGWGLYAELLADELQLYSGPAARFGMLNFQAWRAARLVVDSGLHALGWSRDQAIDFMNHNVYLPRVDIDNEVDRYIASPGQALAYMSGRMELSALREQAQKKQGSAFSLPAFHEEVLRHGALPLPVLRDTVGLWLTTKAPVAEGEAHAPGLVHD